MSSSCSGPLTHHQMPQRDPHLQFQRWAYQYGPIFSLIIGTKAFIVLSTDTAVKDLVDKRSAICSDRPDSYIGQDLCSGGMRLVLVVSLPCINIRSQYLPDWL